MKAEKIGIVGGGINGLCAAWEMAQLGHQVTLYERGEIMQQTSRASSKMLHGGLRYLENYALRLVKESLHERQWWLDNAPHLVQPLQLFIPVYKHGARRRWQLLLGLMAYDWLAGNSQLGGHKRYSAAEFARLNPQLKTRDLIGGFSYFDAQMDDYALGCWVGEQAKQAGVVIKPHCPVAKLSEDGAITLLSGETARYDWLFNIAGPWAEQLLQQSAIPAKHPLDAVRGSHILFAHTIENGYFLEVPESLEATGARRIFFVLPYKGQTMVGTTEQRQTLEQAIAVSSAEIDYLLTAYNHHFKQAKTRADIVQPFAGVRPLIRSKAGANKASREYQITKQGRLVTVYGGKWTTARALAKRLGSLI